MLWETEYACPIKRSDCNLTLANGEKLNLESMRSPQDFYVAPEYSVNICGSLQSGCVSNVSNSIACQKFSFVQYSLGSADNFTFSFSEHDRRLNISYFGGDGGRSTNYLVFCSTDYQDPFFYNEDPSKVYNFVWRSPLVCNSTMIPQFLKKNQLKKR